MAKRLTDTEKWNDEWYISLNNDYRIIWQWLLDNCSHGGFCKRSMTLLNLMCRLSISEDEMIEQMRGRVIIHGNDWFIPKFIKFQYSTLLSLKPVILSVVKELFLKKATHLIPEAFGESYTIISQSFTNHYEMIKDKDKSKDKDSLEGGTGETNKNQNQSKNGKASKYGLNREAQSAGVYLDRASKRMEKEAHGS